MKILRLGRHLRLGEMLISISIVLWSATPSTTLSFLIRSGLFVLKHNIENIVRIALGMSGYVYVLS